MAGSGGGPTLTQLPGWRVGILFAMFWLVAFLWHTGTHALDRHLKRKGKRGLRHVLRALQEEVLMLGVISLLLVAIEEYLLKICVPCDPSDSDSCYWGCGSGPDADPAECAVATQECGAGSEPFWSATAIIQAHILLFVIAVTHIIYTFVVMVLCLWKVGRWRKYEEQSRFGMHPIRYSSVPVPSGNPVVHFFQCVGSMFTESVNAEVYSGLRRLFLERMDIDASFDFHGFVREGMEEEMAQIIGVQWVLWAIVILWIALPPQAWVMVWMGGLSALMLFAVGVKLESIINQLTVDAYQKYGVPCSPPHSPSHALRLVRASLHRLSPLPLVGGLLSRVSGGLVGSSKGDVEGQHAQQEAAQRARHDDTAAGEVGQNGHEGAALPWWQHMECQPGAANEAAAAAGEHGGDPADPSCTVCMSQQRGQQPQQAGQQPQQAGQQEGRGSRAVARTGSGADWDTSDDEGEHGSPNNTGTAAGAAAGAGQVRQPSEQQLHPQEQEQNGAARLESGQGGFSGATAVSFKEWDPDSSGGNHSGHSGHSSGGDGWRAWFSGLLAGVRAAARGCSSCWGWCGGGLQDGRLERSASFAASYKGLDAASLFWFGRPRIMLRIIQLVYFENSLALATLLFSLWQDVDFDWGRGQDQQWPVILAMTLLDIAILVFSALFVLPVYAMTNAAGSHCPASIIHQALKQKRLAPMARALQRLSMDRAVEEQLPLPPPQGAEAVEVEAEGPSPGPLSPEGAAGAAGGAAAAAAAAAAGSVAAPGGEAGWPQAPGEAPPLSSAGPGQEGVAAFPGWGALPALRRMSVSAGQGGGGPQGPGSPRQPASPAGSAAGRSPRAFARGAVAAPPGRPSLGRSSMGSPWGELAGPPTLGPPTLGRASMGSGFSVEVERLPDEGHHMAAALTHVPPLPPGALLPAGAGEEEEEDGQRSVTRLLGAMYQRQLRRQLERASGGMPRVDSPTAQRAQQAWWPESEPHACSMPSVAALRHLQQQDYTHSMPAGLRLNAKHEQAKQRPTLADIQGMFRASADGAAASDGASAAVPGQLDKPASLRLQPGVERESTLTMPFVRSAAQQRRPSLEDARRMFQAHAEGLQLGREPSLTAAPAQAHQKSSGGKDPGAS